MSLLEVPFGVVRACGPIQGGAEVAVSESQVLEAAEGARAEVGLLLQEEIQRDLFEVGPAEPFLFVAVE